MKAVLFQILTSAIVYSLGDVDVGGTCGGNAFNPPPCKSGLQCVYTPPPGPGPIPSDYPGHCHAVSQPGQACGGAAAYPPVCTSGYSCPEVAHEGSTCQPTIACTALAKSCPDGSYVSQVVVNNKCVWPPCPPVGCNGTCKNGRVCKPVCKVASTTQIVSRCLLPTTKNVTKPPICPQGCSTAPKPCPTCHGVCVLDGLLISACGPSSSTASAPFPKCLGLDKVCGGNKVDQGVCKPDLQCLLPSGLPVKGDKTGKCQRRIN